jgi:hypothetical protein
MATPVLDDKLAIGGGAPGGFGPLGHDHPGNKFVQHD